jgi:Flp pilus assembly protein TadD
MLFFQAVNMPHRTLLKPRRRIDLAAYLVLIAILSGCAAKTGIDDVIPTYDPSLLSGVSIFGTEVLVDEVADVDVLHTTPQMHDFVAGIEDSRLTVVRFRQLLARLKESGFFDNLYDPTVTRTAAQTFDDKVGNCISYTNLFVALARAVGLDVNYQIVEMPYPTYNVDTGLLIRNNHINVLVNGARFYRNRTTGHTVDFNLVDPDPDAQVRRVSDAYAKSLFLANWSVDALMRGEERLAFAFLRRALETAPRNPDLWINLGAFYGRHGQYRDAIASFSVARTLRPQEKITMSGLERAHRALGNLELADQLARQVASYRQSNPFYHFAVAQTAYAEKEFVEALTAIERAIRLAQRNPRFHYFKSLTLAQLGEVERSHRALLKAKRLGRFDDLELRYRALNTGLATSR